ncbi:MAG: glycosyltransferase family 9 protein [Ignavibacteria bacterium]
MIIKKDKVKKILLIKLRGIGDVILSSVVFNNLRREFPDATIDYLTEPPSRLALEGLDIINEVIIFDKRKRAGALSLIVNIRKRKYDLVMDFYSNPRTALITFLSGATYRAGFPYKGRKYAYNLFGPAERDSYHAADLHLEFLKGIGLSVSSNELFFSLTQQDIDFAGNFIKDTFGQSSFVVGISPSGGWPSKKCDSSKFAEIGDAMVAKYSAKILILWGPGDELQADEIKSLMQHEPVPAPKTDIRRMGALLSVCNLIIANDSGPMHIATAVKTPVLSLHGPTNPKLQGPYGEMHEWIRLDSLDCIECNLLDCPRNHECFLEMPVSAVIKKAGILIKKNKLII